MTKLTFEYLENIFNLINNQRHENEDKIAVFTYWIYKLKKNPDRMQWNENSHMWLPET